MTIVGDGDFRYELDETWPNIPEGWELGLCSDVAVDSRDRVFVFNRGIHSVAIFDAASGDFLTSWGEGKFKQAHGIFIGPDDSVYLTDLQAHVVTKHTPQGELLMELGRRDFASITVDTLGNYGAPFNQPSGVALSAEGKLFCSDGYANFKVHRFSADGELELSWGIPGTGPGEFALLHNVVVDPRGRVLIADRENHRVQVFDQDGGFIEEWADEFRQPGDFYIKDDVIFLVEQGLPIGISVLDLDGKIITRWRGPDNGIVAPHGIWGDSKGNLFVAEIGDPETGQRMRKYVKI